MQQSLFGGASPTQASGSGYYGGGQTQAAPINTTYSSDGFTPGNIETGGPGSAATQQAVALGSGFTPEQLAKYTPEQLSIMGSTGGGQQANSQATQQAAQGGQQQMGLTQMLDAATGSAEATRAGVQNAKLGTDVRDVNQYGQAATDALRGADSELNQVRQNAQDQANGFTGNDGYYQNELDNSNILQNEAMTRINLNPEMRREADQQARASAQAYGRSGDNSSIASEILNREAYKRQARGEAAGAINNTANLQGLRNSDSRAAQGQAFGMNMATSAAPALQNLFGQQSNAQQYGMNATMMGQGLMGQATNQLFNPDAGVNLDLMNNSNQAAFDASIYGSNAALLGANNAASSKSKDALWGAVGSILGGALS
jgi:hypothetical protein